MTRNTKTEPRHILWHGYASCVTLHTWTSQNILQGGNIDPFGPVTEAVVDSEQMTCSKAQNLHQKQSQTPTSYLLALNSGHHSTESQHNGAWKLSGNLEIVSPNRCGALSRYLLPFTSLNPVSRLRSRAGGDLQSSFLWKHSERIFKIKEENMLKKIDCWWNCLFQVDIIHQPRV